MGREGTFARRIACVTRASAQHGGAVSEANDARRQVAGLGVRREAKSRVGWGRLLLKGACKGVVGCRRWFLVVHAENGVGTCTRSRVRGGVVGL